MLAGCKAMSRPTLEPLGEQDESANLPGLLAKAMVCRWGGGGGS